jgi:hypothetical protein
LIFGRYQPTPVVPSLVFKETPLKLKNSSRNRIRTVSSMWTRAQSSLSALERESTTNCWNKALFHWNFEILLSGFWLFVAYICTFLCLSALAHDILPVDTLLLLLTLLVTVKLLHRVCYHASN